MTAVFTHAYALVALGRVTGTAFSQRAQVSHRVLEVSPPQGNQSNIEVCGDGAWSSPLAFSTAPFSLSIDCRPRSLLVPPPGTPLRPSWRQCLAPRAGTAEPKAPPELLQHLRVLCLPKHLSQAHALQGTTAAAAPGPRGTEQPATATAGGKTAS